MNQVRYNPQTHLLASSGVEKMIKLWSDWEFKPETGGANNARKIYTQQNYIDLVLRSDNILQLDTYHRYFIVSTTNGTIATF